MEILFFLIEGQVELVDDFHQLLVLFLVSLRIGELSLNVLLLPLKKLFDPALISTNGVFKDLNFGRVALIELLNRST